MIEQQRRQQFLFISGRSFLKTIISIKCLTITPVNAWVDHYDEGEDDAKVVKIFLPLIACAILTCIAGCYFKKHCEGDRESSNDVEGGDPDIVPVTSYQRHTNDQNPDTKSVKSLKVPPIDPTLSDFDRKMMERRQSRMSKGKSLEEHPTGIDNLSINHGVNGDIRRGSRDSVGSNNGHNHHHHNHHAPVGRYGSMGMMSGNHSPTRHPGQPGIPPHSPVNGMNKKTTSRNTEMTVFDSSENSTSPSFQQQKDQSDATIPPQARPRSNTTNAKHQALRNQMSNTSHLSQISRSQTEHPSRRVSRHASGTGNNPFESRFSHNKEHVEINNNSMNNNNFPEFSQWKYLLEKDPCDMTEDELLKWQQLSRAKLNGMNMNGNGDLASRRDSLPNRPPGNDHHY